jgi:hypothetical protein
MAKFDVLHPSGLADIGLLAAWLWVGLTAVTRLQPRALLDAQRAARSRPPFMRIGLQTIAFYSAFTETDTSSRQL